MSDSRRPRRSDRHRAGGSTIPPGTGQFRQDDGDTQRYSAPPQAQPDSRRSPEPRRRMPPPRNAPPPRKQGLPFYRSPWLMLALLFLLPPAGIFLLWKYGRQMRTVKLVMTVISVLWLALLVWLIVPKPQAAPPSSLATDPSGVEMTVSGPQPQEVQTTDTEVQTVDVYDGTDIIGQRAFLSIPAETVQDFTGRELATIADTYVRGRGYSWFTVVMDDGSGEGYVFSDDTAETAVYGILGDDGTIASPIEILYRSGNDYIPE